MSLVIDALRRVEKKDPAGSVGSASVRVGGRRSGRRSWPVLLAASGGLAVGLAVPQERTAPAAAARPVEPRDSSPWGPGRSVLAASDPVAGAAASVPARETSAPRRVRAASPAAAATATQTPAAQAHVLQAVSTRDGAPIAMVNGRLVREGDTIDGFRVTKIAGETVTGTRADGTEAVLVFPELLPLPEPSPTWDPRSPADH
jgi:hypothetical protein